MAMAANRLGLIVEPAGAAILAVVATLQHRQRLGCPRAPGEPVGDGVDTLRLNDLTRGERALSAGKTVRACPTQMAL
jgi:hypothetical protein